MALFSHFSCRSSRITSSTSSSNKDSGAEIVVEIVAAGASLQVFAPSSPSGSTVTASPQVLVDSSAAASCEPTTGQLHLENLEQQTLPVSCSAASPVGTSLAVSRGNLISDKDFWIGLHSHILFILFLLLS